MQLGGHHVSGRCAHAGLGPYGSAADAVAADDEPSGPDLVADYAGGIAARVRTDDGVAVPGDVFLLMAQSVSRVPTWCSLPRCRGAIRRWPTRPDALGEVGRPLRTGAPLVAERFLEHYVEWGRARPPGLDVVFVRHLADVVAYLCGAGSIDACDTLDGLWRRSFSGEAQTW